MLHRPDSEKAPDQPKTQIYPLVSFLLQSHGSGFYIYILFWNTHTFPKKMHAKVCTMYALKKNGGSFDVTISKR